MLTAILLSLSTAAAATAAVPNACQMLTPRDVARVQGAKYTRTRLSETTGAGVTVSQCFYALPHLTDSVTVDLIRGNARDFWQQHFAEARDERDEHEVTGASMIPTIPATKRDREPEEQNKPRLVEGIGDRAAWSGNRIAGAPYVLRGETVVRGG